MEGLTRNRRIAGWGIGVLSFILLVAALLQIIGAVFLLTHLEQQYGLLPSLFSVETLGAVVWFIYYTVLQSVKFWAPLLVGLAGLYLSRQLLANGNKASMEEDS